MQSDLEHVTFHSNFKDGAFISNNAKLSALKALSIVKTINMSPRYKNRLDLLSFDLYGYVDYWWCLAIINNIINPFNFDVTQFNAPALKDLDDVLLSEY